MAEIFSCMSAWLAPVLSFTAEEAWSYRPEGMFGDEQSVHLREFPAVPVNWQNDVLAEKWKEIQSVRKSVLEAIEPLRASKELGSSLAAMPVLTTTSEAVKSLEGDMADICITSQIEIRSVQSIEEFLGEEVEIKKAEGSKCQRCWKILPEVEENGDLCNRCADVVAQSKEKAA